MQGKVEICGINTARLKVLKSEETRELLVKSRNGDSAAREALIYGNLRLVLSSGSETGGRTRTTCSKWDVLGLSRPSTTLTWSRGCSSPPMEFP